MNDDSKQSPTPPDTNADANTAKADTSSGRYQHKHATRVVPMKIDAFGRMYWESFHTPASFEVRAEALIPPHLPGIVIFVHGVNSQGEWYDDAEAALCDGLNKRLNRGDLKANEYKTTDAEGKTAKRRLDKANCSPVIRFYWGYRAKAGEEEQWRIPMRNVRGADFWKQKEGDRGPWCWGGGPFQNGTNNLQQMWSKTGFRKHVAGINLQAFNTEWDREVHDAPPRTYGAHAAQRLADMIDKIRENSPRDTITIMSHSQGTMVAMAATLLCKTRAPDALIVMNSPFALKDKFTDSLTCGNERPTTGARVRTFKAIAQRIKSDKQVYTEELMRQLQVGASEDMNFWRPDLKLHYGLPERDNHGRLYVYFNPHDRVMGSAPLQSIGWQGVDDHLLAELGDTVKQRMLARGMACGDDPGVRSFGSLPPISDPEAGVNPDDFWNGNRRVLGTLLWTVPNRNQKVTINAEKVPEPITAEEMSKPYQKDIVTKKGEDVRQVYFDESRRDQDMLAAQDLTGQYKDDGYLYLDSIYDRQLWMEREDMYSNTGKRRELETEQERHKRIAEYQPMPTNHSTLPKHHAFMSRVVAYDLPIGFCDAYEISKEFWYGLMQDADWTQMADPYYADGLLSVPAMPSTIDAETIAEVVTKADQEQQTWRGA
ncbi:T6SS effector phospholipase Tle3 domain-containing protein [Caballeronia sp. DA-9]|uniref:T6SS effector phospholipase Tle3 domain-containing protein n=1 Tax=Caballeronia sp. DA-9 TaxID=3436237 RepID=UPI003F67F9FC